MKDKHKFILGNKVKDAVTGFTGIVTGRCEYINGCVQYLVKPPVDEKGVMRDGEWIDSQQLHLVDPGIAKAQNKIGTGGPMSERPPEQYMG